MKYTKKMILVPEAEYLALLGMLKPKDSLSLEKAKVESEMATALRKPKVNADLTMKKYDWLLKQKRNLKEKIDEIPQKVQIENLDELLAPPSVPGYMGIGTSNSSFKSARSSESEESSAPAEPEVVPDFTRTIRRIKHIIRERDVPALKTYLSENKKLFGIAGDDRILSHGTNRPIAGTNFLDVIDYLAKRPRDRGVAPRGINMLLSNLNEDPYYHTLIAKAQQGRGKITPIKKKQTKLIKITKGKIFKPILWAKL